MRLSSALLMIGTFVLSPLSFSQERPCRTVEFVRVENSRQLERLQDVCEIRQSLAIFTSDLKEVVLPRLKHVGIVNVEANGLEALAFPALETARDIYLTGSDLKVAEFPVLNTVSARLVIQQRNLQFLRLPELRRVGRLILNGCLNLEFVFADKLYDVATIRLDNNPALNPASEEKLRSVTRVMTPEELAFIKNSEEQMKLFKRRLIEKTLTETPIRPTGHPTQFDSFGLIKSYYSWYPYEYSRFYDFIGPWGYSWIYMIP
jgi:hypothetical protein